MTGAQPSKVPTSILGGQSFTGFNFCLVRQIAGVLRTSQNVKREGIEGAPSDSIDTVSVADNSVSFINTEVKKKKEIVKLPKGK